jgi:hypothetical protein
MADVKPAQEPQSAADYYDRTTAAVKSVLIEVGQVLGSFRGKFAIIGGAVPWLLLDNEEMPHVGSMDVDISLDADALGDGEYATLVEALMGMATSSARASGASSSCARSQQPMADRPSTWSLIS